MTKGIIVLLIVFLTALLPVSYQCISDLGQHNYGDIFPMNKTIYEGGNVNFTCVLNDETLKNCTSADIIWHFNNDLDPINSYSIVNQSHNVLSLYNVTVESSGSYFCMIRNLFGNLFVCSSVLTVGRKVKLENVTIISYNLQDLRITWTVKDNYINTTYSLGYRSIKKTPKECPIKCLRSEKKEYFNCSCYINGSAFLYLNSHQFSIKSHNVLNNDTIYEATIEPEHYIKTKPPTSLEAVSKNSSTLFASWDLQFHNPPQNLSLLYYEVFCIPIVNNEPEQQHYKVVNTTHKNVTFNDLIPFRNYIIKVHAKVNYSESYYSDFAVINATTLQDVPQDAPFILPGMFFFKNSIESPRKVYIYWKDINKLSYGSPNINYSVLLESENSKKKILTNETNIIVEIGDDAYNATIRAANHRGPARKFSTIFIPAKNNILKNLDLEFFLRMKNPDRLNISCVLLPKSSDIATITVYWCKGSSFSSMCLRNLNWTISDKDSSSWEIPIDINSHYQVATSVQSLSSSSGLKFWSDCEAIDTDNMNDLDVTFKPLSSSVLIRWQANCKQNSIIKYHIITYCPLSNCKNNTILKKDVAKNTTECTLYDLTPFTEYNITFFSISVTGKRIVRKNAVVVTEQGQPGGPPQNIRAAVGIHNISFEWSQPEKPNGILSYRIEVSENGKDLLYKLPPVETTSCILPNLTENTKYQIKIKACSTMCSDSATIKKGDCSIMCSDPAIINIKTEATVPPEIFNVTIKAEETDKVSLSWMLETSDGPIDYYYVYVQWSEDAERKTYMAKRNISKPFHLEQKVNCSRVETEYTFKIAAVRINLNKTELIGKQSNQTSVRLCKSGYRDNIILIVGCIVAITALFVLVFILFGSKVFRKLREHIRIPEISLPQGISEKVDDFYDQPPRKKIGFEKKNNVYEDLQPKPHFMDSERFLGTKLKSDSESLLLDQMPTADEFGRQVSSMSTASSGIGSGDQNSISSATSHCTNVSSDSGTVINERCKDVFESLQAKPSIPDKLVMSSYIPKDDILFTARISKDFGLSQKSPIYKPESLPSVFFHANEGTSSIKLNPGYSTTTYFQDTEELNCTHKSHSYPKLGPYYEKPNVMQCYVPLDNLKSSFAKYLPTSFQNSYSKFAPIPIYDIDNMKHDIPIVEDENAKPLDPYCKISSNESDITEIEATNTPFWQSKPLETYVQIVEPEASEKEDMHTVNSYIIDSDLSFDVPSAEDTTISETEGYSLPLSKREPEVSPYSKFIIQDSDDMSKSSVEDIFPTISSDIHSFEKDISKSPYVPSVIFMNRKNSIPENYSKVCILKDKLDNAVNNLDYMQNSSTA